MKQAQIDALDQFRDKCAGIGTARGMTIEKHTDPSIGAVWYTKRSENGVLYGIGFSGNRSNPDFQYRYLDETQRRNNINRWLENLRYNASTRAARKAEKAEFVTSLQQGDILYASWGYDQTNATWYEITRVIGKRCIEIREIKGEARNCYEVPLPGEYIGPVEKKVVQGGDRVAWKSYAHLHKWDGQPKQVSGPYEGH